MRTLARFAHQAAGLARPAFSRPCAARPPACARRALAVVADANGPALVQRLKDDMKTAMKAKDQARLDCIRFLNAAIKQREIELRESSQAVTDAEVVKVLQKLSKQRKDSIDSYKAGGRDDLVAKELAELAILESYMPAMISGAELEAIVVQAIAESGAKTQKQMGAVMKAVTAKTGGRADGKAVSDLVKAKLTSV